MFMFDIETLGVASDSVVLSMACIHFDPRTNPTYKELKESAFFVKLDAKDQITRLNRKVDKKTVEWWGKQCQNVKTKSLTPCKDDILVEDALSALRTWVKERDDGKCYVWARGSMDEVVMQALERSVMREGEDHIFLYSRFRDVRTAIDFLTGNINGYCQVDHPSFNYDIDVTKHDPVDDCALDIMMLLYGKGKIT
jgi:hypothetical protein